MRDKIIEELIKEVYGPRNYGKKDSIENIVHETMTGDPYKEYLTGVIVPKSLKINQMTLGKTPDSEHTNEDNNLDSDDDEDTFVVSNNVNSDIDPRMRAKTFGVSFFVEKTKPVIKLAVTWARYFNQSNEDEQSGEWERKPYYYPPTDINLTDFFNKEYISIYDNEKEGKIDLSIRVKDYDDLYHVNVNLINNLVHNVNDFNPKVSSCIFQPSIRINIEGKLSNYNKKENDTLSYIYKDRPIKSKGHMCSSIWSDIDYADNIDEKVLWPDGLYFEKELSEFKYPDIRTEFVPLYPMPTSKFNILDESEDSCLDPSILSELTENEDIKTIFEPLLSKYESWINENEKAEKEDYESIVNDIIFKQKNTLSRIKQGINILINNEDVNLAFCFANKCIQLQHEWKTAANDSKFKWREFQLAFFLMNLESIVNKKSKDRNKLDLLWIATGGGKTEAYLGIMAFTIAYRRLSSVKKGQSGVGTSILSRYTLRLLTVQQFRRTLSLVTAAEYLRVYENDSLHGWRPESSNNKKDWLYGTTRFSVGMWVGRAVTPLDMRGDNGAITQLEYVSYDENIHDVGDPAQVLRCPVCNHWISIPNNIIKESNDSHKIHLIVKNYNNNIAYDDIISEINKFNIVDYCEISDNNLKNGYITLTINFIDEDISQKSLNPIKSYLTSNHEIASLNFYRLGYYGTHKGGTKQKFLDYEIFCNNPDCKLNHIHWEEGIPLNDETTKVYPDGNTYRNIPNLPFDNRMPIPAYTVDEQVYTKLPTIVISTADKIARLAFEPKAAAMFGNVNYYSRVYGFIRDDTNDLLPKPKQFVYKKQFHLTPLNENIQAPDLIIQDELHLIDGPLGSLFGLYEMVIQAIIEKKSGKIPKYIASTATINNSEEQAKLVFNKKVNQFPPHGLTIEDNFFVKEEITNKVSESSTWDEQNPGRIYMGIYTPGRGALTPQIRLWSSILNTCEINKNDPSAYYYWTLIGYYNSMRELGGGHALYKEDIVERLHNINSKRELRQDPKELSSRISSIEIPHLLNEIELDGAKKGLPENDAIFTTSMFGTGVDISHLSNMIVNGQPKTTASYIQATGRIGRSHGGLVVTFLKAGKPRDLDHYETFPAYHHRLHLGIEPVSVSPFSQGALKKALGSSLVSYLRNVSKTKISWTENSEARNIKNKKLEDINDFKEFLIRRLKEMEFNNEFSDEVILTFENCVQNWEDALTERLDFYEYQNKYRKMEKDVVLGDPAHEAKKELKTVYKNVPQSLREIEQTTGFWV